jgi:hypothetical protein
MTKSMLAAALLAAALAACSQSPAPPPLSSDTANAAAGSFVPYCGPTWSVARQGYVHIPCPPGSGYESGLHG